MWEQICWGFFSARSAEGVFFPHTSYRAVWLHLAWLLTLGYGRKFMTWAVRSLTSRSNFIEIEVSLYKCTRIHVCTRRDRPMRWAVPSLTSKSDFSEMEVPSYTCVYTCCKETWLPRTWPGVEAKRLAVCLASWGFVVQKFGPLIKLASSVALLSWLLHNFLWGGRGFESPMDILVYAFCHSDLGLRSCTVRKGRASRATSKGQDRL